MAQLERVEVETPVGHLRVGMYVCRLDRPWEGTPFSFQGFQIESDDQILELCQYCNAVFVDERRRVADRRVDRPIRYQEVQPLTRPDALERLDRMGFRFMRGPDRPILIPVEYGPPLRTSQELARASNAWRQLRTVVSSGIAKARAGKPYPVAELDAAVVAVIESVVRGPDASMWLVAQRHRESYPVAHPLNCCALLLSYSRFLCFPPEVLLSLAKAALLCDIGMWRLDQNYYINRQPADEDTRVTIEEHVLTGLEYLNQSGFVDIDAVLAITHHHERLDGDGYPRRVRGDKISLMGFMLQIVDAFDALRNRRAHAPEHTVQEAQRILYQMRESAFPGEVLEQFFQSLGVYPTGSLVELSDGSIAVVSSQSSASRLYPWIIRMRRPDGSAEDDHQEIWAGEMIKREEPIRIIRGLPFGYEGLKIEDVAPVASL